MTMKASFSTLIIGLLMCETSTAGEGHDAGYRRAEQHDIDDPDGCHSRSGNNINKSPSFTEGCLEYLRDEGITDEDNEPIDEAPDGGDES